jgi:hypothetical protein
LYIFKHDKFRFRNPTTPELRLGEDPKNKKKKKKSCKPVIIFFPMSSAPLT